MRPPQFAPLTADTEHDERETAPPVRRAVAPLVVGAADDRAEVEADRVADEVISRLQGGPEATAGETHVHHDCHGVARSAAPASGGAEVGYAGGAISDELTTRIEGKRGSGSTLDGGVRRRMESGFGRSLGDVRIHTDTEAADLNRSVSARAFTTGKDIFFGRGEYSPGTAAGERVLAHELAHTQQAGAGVGRIHRFAIGNPDFSTTTSIDIMQWGASGLAAQFTDGGAPLVVKSNQMTASEVLVSAKLHAAMGAAGAEPGKGKSRKGAAKVVAPDGTRLATPGEITALKTVYDRFLKDPAGSKIGTGARHDGQNFREGLDSPLPTVIAEKVDGQTMAQVLADKDANVEQKGSKLAAKKDSAITKLCRDSSTLTVLGRSMMVDVLMGMDDRLVGHGVNAENFNFDVETGTFGFIDNTRKGLGGLLTTLGTDTARGSFDYWAGKDYLKTLKKGTGELATATWDKVFSADEGLLWHAGIAARTAKVPKEDFAAIKTVFLTEATKNRKKMIGWITSGMDSGMRNLLTAMKNPLPFVEGLPEVQKREALVNVIARRNVLQGVAPAAAWTQAEAEADRLLPATVTAPPRPTSAAPATPTTKTSSWKQGVTPGRGRVVAGAHRR